MTRGSRIFLYVGAGFLALAIILGVTALIVVQSDWFREEVRQRIVAEVEKATGGDVEIGSFDFDWRSLRAEVKNFVIHGTEPDSAPPLFRADSVRVELKIISILRQMVDIASLDVTKPQVHLIISADGSTNVPEPKVKKPSDRTAMETILDLAIRRFSIEDGLLDVANRSKTPFHGRGQNLRAKFQYDQGGPRYTGTLAMSPLDLQLGDNKPLPIDVDLDLSLERNRIQIARAGLRSGDSAVRFSGAIDDLVNPRGSFTYDVSLAVGQLGQYFGLTSSPPSGSIAVNGSGNFTGADSYAVSGDLKASNIDFQRGGFMLRDFSADGVIAATPERIQLRNADIAGVMRASAGAEAVRVQGNVGNISLTGRDVKAESVRIAALGGRFTGQAEIRDFSRYTVQGNLSDFRLKEAAGLAGREDLPWDGAVSGPVTIEGSLGQGGGMTASARLDITPTETAMPVSGTVEARYDSRSGTLDLGRSRLQLPGTTAEVSGILGRALKVHLETRNFNDLLPALGADTTIPVRLNNGVAIFEGTVTGALDRPEIAGRLTATNLVYENRQLDSLAASIQASPSRVAVRDGILVKDTVKVPFELALELQRWKPQPSSALSAKASISQASIGDLLKIAEQEAPAAGTLTASAEISGTYGDPRVQAALEALKGSVYGEPFDRITATVNYAPGRADVGSAELIAGDKRVKLTASFQHQRDNFRDGKLQFNIASNPMALQSIQNVAERRPGLEGVAQLAADGVIAISTRAGSTTFDISSLNANLSARGVRMGEQDVGNLRLVASTQGNMLTAHVESDFADSAVKGDGRWQLSGNYPGSAEVTFSRLAFDNLRRWIGGSDAERIPVDGFIEGRATLEGPLRNPNAWRAAVEIPKMEIGPRADSDIAEQARGYRLRNEGPIRATVANSVLRVEQAHLVGRATDLRVEGNIAFRQKAPLDLKAKGTVDIALAEQFHDDVFSSGVVALDAAVRGSFQQPLVNGRLELKDAAFNYARFPSGISNANGVILFSGNRATIQTLKGETGGGTVAVSGFAQISPMVFRLNATASEVRVRYPEGVSTVANADVNLTGTAARSLLSGKVTILRTGFNPRSDLSSILAKTAEPVRTPAARSGALANMQLDVEIETAPDITFQTALAQDISAEADLRLRGTVLNPALLGRVNITQGEMLFFGTKYTINQGSISFYNPVKIEPVLNIDLETRARGIDVVLTVSGPINRLNLTPRSDPPLQFSEIIALLATGRAPTTDPTLAAREASQQSWQQMGASALVGQAIANPVAGRLQRFFGVSRLKIDPSFSGVENNPQARLTLEQQITRDITFTYITNVTTSNPQVIRVEWAVSQRFSVIAVRDENGFFGMDFLYKRRF